MLGALTSGHTDAGKILSIYRTVDSYTIPLHEFVKSIGLGDSKYYHGELSFVLNLYSISDESRPSHFTKLRLLEYLFFHRNRSAAGYGLGFVRTDVLKREFEKIGTSDTDITESLKLQFGNCGIGGRRPISLLLASSVVLSLQMSRHFNKATTLLPKVTRSSRKKFLLR